jgi:Uma2 family endonuclease
MASRAPSSPSISAPLPEQAGPTDASGRPCYSSPVPSAGKPGATRAAIDPLEPGKRWTRDEYLAFEREAEAKHEFSDGRVFAMAGASVPHDRLAGTIRRLLGNALASEPCDVFSSDVRVVTALGKYYYPDASALCGPLELEEGVAPDTLLNPQVIVEVLSPSTEANDRDEKFAAYRTIDSFKEYVLVSQEEVLVEHFVREPDDSWTKTELRAGEELELSSLNCKIQVDEIYAKAFKARRRGGSP